MPAQVSLVVIAYNEAGNIGRALDAIASLDGLGEYEVVVVNDGSRDGTAGVVRDRAAGKIGTSPVAAAGPADVALQVFWTTPARRLVTAQLSVTGGWSQPLNLGGSVTETGTSG